MKYSFSVHLLLVFISSKLIVSKDIIVDADLTEKNGNSYPTLNQAIVALLNDDIQNTITLKANCAGTEQYLFRPYQELIGSIQNVSLTIKFENTPQFIDNIDLCNRLPTLVLGNNSCLYISNFSSFTIVGLNIQYIGDACMNFLTDISTLTFSNFCFNNSEPSKSLAAGVFPYIEISSVGALSMINGIYIYDAVKEVWIHRTKEVIFANITLVASAASIDSTNAALHILNNDSISTNLTLQNFQIRCEPATLTIPASVWIRNVSQVRISHINISNCDFNGPATKNQAAILVTGASTLIIQEVLLYNLTFGLYYQSLFVISRIEDAALIDFHIVNLVAPYDDKYDAQVVYFNDFEKISPYQKQAVTFRRWKLLNCTFSTYKMLINGSFRDFSHLGDTIIENFSITNSSLGWRCPLFNLQIPDVAIRTTEIAHVIMRDIQVTTTNVSFSDMFSVKISNSEFIAAIENARLEVTNFSLSDCFLTRSSIIRTEGFGTYISDIDVVNTAFKTSSSFYVSSMIMSTMLMTNANIRNISLNEYSNFAAANLTTARLLSLDTLFKRNDGVYAETRPFIAYNCIFDSINLSWYSFLIASTNPMILVQKNKFTNISANFLAGLLQLGNYPSFFSSASYFNRLDNGTIYDPGTIYQFPYAENFIFQGYPDLGRIYDDARLHVSEHDPNNSIFFIWINENIFADISTYSTSQLIHLYHFQLKYQTIALVNNNFTRISSNTSLHLISGSIFQSGIFAFNTFSDMNFTGYGFAFVAFYLDNLRLDSNAISQTQKLGLYLIDSLACNQIRINNATAFQVEAHQSFIDLTCGVVAKSVVIQGSRFENVLQTNTNERTESLNFISLNVKKIAATGSSLLLFQDNYFYNSTVLDTQEYTQKLYKSALIYIVSSGSKFQFHNNTLNLIAALPKGNIMIVSVPVIIFSNSKFSNLTFGSVTGAIHAIFEALSVRASIFSETQSLDSDGVGVFKLANREPHTTALIIIIQNTMFRGNIAPYSSVLYVKDRVIDLQIDRCNFSDNYVTGSGGILTIYNVSTSNILITNSRFSQYADFISTYVDFKIIAVDNSRSHVSVQMSDLTVDVTGIAKGVFISISGQQVVSLIATRILYSAGSDGSFPQFGLFEGDNFNATFTDLRINNISLGQTGLFTVNAITANKANTGEWRLNIMDSKFVGMKLREGLIVLTSDNDGLPTTLNNMSIILQNVYISQINWLGSADGVVKSSTPRIGRSSNETDFAITLNNCTFVDLIGNTGLVISMIEPMFDSVALIIKCRLYSIVARGSGAILNPSPDLPSSTSNDIIITNNRTSRQYPTFRIIENFFENISSSSGTLLYWIGTIRGIEIDSSDNHFDSITCIGHGGLIFVQNLPRRDQMLIQTPESYFNFVSRNDVVVSISGVRDGGIIYAGGVVQLVNITLTNMTLSGVKCSGNGGMAYLVSLPPTTEPTLMASSRLLDSSLGTISISGSTISNIEVTNGGIIYENTPKDILRIYFESNLLKSITALVRGGAFHLSRPMISVRSNIFDMVTAKLAGPIIYSISNHIDLTDFINSNEIIPSLEVPYYSFAPTNLLINFISLSTGSSLVMEYEDTPPYNPIVPNLTSYSLSAYQIILTLVSNGPEGLQLVYDESSSPLVTLNFISSKGESTQTYVGSNCSNSACTVLASTIILQGLAGDLILVNAAYNSSVYTQFQKFRIRLRGCLPGEINNTASYECIYCLRGTYSFTPNDTKCSECPNGAICNGGSEVIVRKGFYRSHASLTSLYIIDCNDSGGRCLGGVNNTCAPPYSGPACLQCNLENGYFMSANSGTCVLCSKKATLLAVAGLLLAGSIIFQIVMSIITYRENKRIHVQYQEHHRLNTIQPGQFLVIFSAYAQITSVVANLDQNTVSYLLKVTDTVGNPYTQVMFSLQCLYLLYIPDPFRALRFKVLVYVFSPMVKVLLVIIFECFRNLIWKDSEGQRLKNSLVRVGAVAVVLILLEQPGIIGVLSKYLTCARLDPFIDEYYIKTHNSVQCYTEEYNFLKNAVIIPALTFWALIVPLGIFFILFKIRRRLFVSEPLRIVFGNFYNSYYESSYYWGVIIITFKVMIYVLNSVISTSPILKGVIFTMIIHSYYYLLRRKSPYPYKYLFLAEKLCCAAYMTTLALVFLRLSTDHYGIKYACSVLIVITVSIAGLYILLNTIWILLLKFGRYIAKIKERGKEKRIRFEILESLRRYHENHPSHIDKHHRRGAILVELPER